MTSGRLIGICFLLALLCAIGSVAYYINKGRIERENLTYDKIWTVELVGSNQSYRFRSALGTFLIHKSRDIDAINRTVSGLPVLSLRWAYPGGEPWPLWQSNNPEPDKKRLRNQLTTTVSVIKPGKDPAAIAKEIYLDDRMKSANRALVPVFQKMVWDGEAAVYRSFRKTIYLIEQRGPLDVRLIVCTDRAAYCRMHGARLTKSLRLKGILIPQDKVAQWKQYQQKTRELLKAMMLGEDQSR